MFSALPVGTTFWGVTVDMVFNFPISSPIHIKVGGNSGTLPFDVIEPQNVFFGFHEPLGLLSVSFQNLDSLNYSFDDVITSQPQQAVPEPSTLALLLAACGAAGIAHRQHRKRAHHQ